MEQFCYHGNLLCLHFMIDILYHLLQKYAFVPIRHMVCGHGTLVLRFGCFKKKLLHESLLCWHSSTFRLLARLLLRRSRICHGLFLGFVAWIYVPLDDSHLLTLFLGLKGSKLIGLLGCGGGLEGIQRSHGLRDRQKRQKIIFFIIMLLV